MNVDVFLAGSGIGVLLVIARTLGDLYHASRPTRSGRWWRVALITGPMGIVGFVSVPLMAVGLAFGYALTIVANTVYIAAERKFPSAPARLKEPVAAL
jgi:hypothetical protein